MLVYLGEGVFNSPNPLVAIEFNLFILGLNSEFRIMKTTFSTVSIFNKNPKFSMHIIQIDSVDVIKHIIVIVPHPVQYG